MRGLWRGAFASHPPSESDEHAQAKADTGEAVFEALFGHCGDSLTDWTSQSTTSPPVSSSITSAANSLNFLRASAASLASTLHVSTWVTRITASNDGITHPPS